MLLVGVVGSGWQRFGFCPRDASQPAAAARTQNAASNQLQDDMLFRFSTTPHHPFLHLRYRPGIASTTSSVSTAIRDAQSGFDPMSAVLDPPWLWARTVIAHVATGHMR